MIKKFGYKILHYLYINRDTVYSVAKNYYKNPNVNIDGKLTFDEVMFLIKEIRNSGVIPDEDIPVGAEFGEVSDFVAGLKDNTYKQLQQYRQKGPTCAIYSMGRAVYYNTGIFSSQDEVEEVAQLARDKGLLTDDGMKFEDSGKVWKEWTGDKIRVLRVPMYSSEFQSLTSKGYSYVTGGGVTESFLLEREDDGNVNIDNIDWTDKKKYYHGWTGETDINFTDNFYGKFKFNRFVNKHHPEFIRRGHFFSWAYFPIREKQEISLDRAKKAVDEGIWNGKRPKDFATREEVASMVYSSKNKK